MKKYPKATPLSTEVFLGPESKNTFVNSAATNQDSEKPKQVLTNNIEFQKVNQKVISPKNINEVVELLQAHICDVQFTRVTNPKAVRMLRCTLNENLLGYKKPGMGVVGTKIVVWAINEMAWKSFYYNSIQKISYDDDPTKYN